jgi:hypothetical protein
VRGSVAASVVWIHGCLGGVVVWRAGGGWIGVERAENAVGPVGKVFLVDGGFSLDGGDAGLAVLLRQRVVV